MRDDIRSECTFGAGSSYGTIDELDERLNQLSSNITIVENVDASVNELAGYVLHENHLIGTKASEIFKLRRLRPPMHVISTLLNKVTRTPVDDLKLWFILDAAGNDQDANNENLLQYLIPLLQGKDPRFTEAVLTMLHRDELDFNIRLNTLKHLNLDVEAGDVHLNDWMIDYPDLNTRNKTTILNGMLTDNVKKYNDIIEEMQRAHHNKKPKRLDFTEH